MTIRTLIDFLHLFAIKHPAILHNDGGLNRFCLNGEDVFTQSSAISATKLDIKNFCMIITPTEMDGTIMNNAHDQCFETLNITVEVAKATKLLDEAAKIEAQATAKSVLDDLLRELQHALYYRRSPFKPIDQFQYPFVGNPTSGGSNNQNMCGYTRTFKFKIPFLSADTFFQSIL